jgi:hypothetical protein
VGLVRELCGHDIDDIEHLATRWPCAWQKYSFVDTTS